MCLIGHQRTKFIRLEFPMPINKKDFETCKECNRLIKITSMASHIEKHAERRKKKFALCPICKHEMRRRRIELSTHFANNHPDHILTESEIIKILTNNRTQSSISNSAGHSIKAVSGGAFGLGKNRRN